MKKITFLFILTGFLFMVGCSKTSNDSTKQQTISTDTTSHDKQNDSSNNKTDNPTNSTIESTTNSTSIRSSSEMTNAPKTSTNDNLSNYTDDQIEYARIWLQLGANQEIDTLYAQKIPAGTPIIPTIPNSAVFPEDVIQLSGGRRVDGSITYGSNHNGTIDIYNVPTNLYWDFYTVSGTSAKTLEEESQKVLSTTKTVSVDTGNTSQIIRLIQLEKYTGNIDLSKNN